MIKNWLNQEELDNDFEDQAFEVVEEARPESFIPRLAQRYLSANVDPNRVERKARRLRDSSRDLGLEEIESILERFISESALPDEDRASIKSGLFGEFLSEEIMVEVNNYERLIYKLRHREASNWAPKLIDVCVLKEDENITLCFIEVKTNSSGTKNSILEKGLSSLLKGLTRKFETLMFISQELEKQERFEEANLIYDLAVFEEYSQENEICLVVDSNCWSINALEKLSNHDDRNNLKDLRVRVILIDELGDVIDRVHEKSLKAGKAISHG
jgi:hypothetical protein